MNDRPMLQTPIRFSAEMEHPEENEAETITRLETEMRSVRETTFAHSGQASRSVHAKAHGILSGTMTVLPGLSPALAQGLFAEAGPFDVVLRLSTIPGDMLDDSVSTPRGLGLKVKGVHGARLPGAETGTEQDFVLANAPAFSAPTATKFLGSLKLLAATTDKVEGLKEVVSRIARVTEAGLEAVGLKSALVTTMGGQPATNVLGETYFSQTPFLFGPYIAKFAVAPVSPGLVALTGATIDVSASPDALRRAVIEHFSTQGGEWEFRVQLMTDAETMPIEDASVAWPENQSPYVAVARISVAPQNAWAAAEIAAVDHCMAFSPWQGLAAHRPLGGVNRARNGTYANSAGFRRDHNGCPMHGG